jgi:hypothetical protein
MSRQRMRGAKQTLRRDLECALVALDGEAPLRDGSVHKARKAIKRARAALRLMRAEIGDAAYRRANLRLRDAARPLSRLRDAKVLLDVIAKLRAHDKDRELATLEEELHREREAARHEVAERPATLRSIRRSIKSVLFESRSWRAPSDAMLRRTVERLYRNGRKAFELADADRSDETLLEARKQSDYLGKALDTRAGQPARAAQRAEAVADALGDDHDLAVLAKKLGDTPRGRTERALLAQLGRRRRKLQRTASKRGRHLYRHKAKSFARAEL